MRYSVPFTLFLLAGCAGSTPAPRNANAPMTPAVTPRHDRTPPPATAATTPSEQPTLAPGACGATYPVEFPCLRGGTPVDTKLARMTIPLVQRLAVVAYRDPPKAVAARLEVAAMTNGWELARREEGAEADGVRYRATFSRGDQLIATSTYPESGATLVQVMQFGPPKEPERTAGR